MHGRRNTDPIQGQLWKNRNHCALAAVTLVPRIVLLSLMVEDDGSQSEIVKIIKIQSSLVINTLV